MPFQSERQTDHQDPENDSVDRGHPGDTQRPRFGMRLHDQADTPRHPSARESAATLCRSLSVAVPPVDLHGIVSDGPRADKEEPHERCGP